MSAKGKPEKLESKKYISKSGAYSDAHAKNPAPAGFGTFY